MLRNTKTLRRRMPVENRSLRLTRKIQNIDLEEKNQVGRGDDLNNDATVSPDLNNGATVSPDLNNGATVSPDLNSSPETKPDNQGTGFINDIVGMIPGLGGSDMDSGEPTEEKKANQLQQADPNRVTSADSSDSAEEDTKSLLSEGLDVVRKSYAEYYGVNEEDIIVDEDGDDITTTGESTLLVGTDNITRFSKNMKKGERVAVLFGITPGLKNGLFVYPDYKTIETASTGKEMYNARVVFDKLKVPFDVKPGYSVKILVCYIETIAPVVKDEQLRLPFIPSISIVNYTKKKTIDDVDDAAEAEAEEAAEGDAIEADEDEEGDAIEGEEEDGSAGIADTFSNSVEKNENENENDEDEDEDGLTSSLRL